MSVRKIIDIDGNHPPLPADKSHRRATARNRVCRLPGYRRWRRAVEAAAAAGLANPFFREQSPLAGARAAIDGEPHICFSSYDYLGMARDPAVIAAAQEATARYGTSVSASRLVAGERDIHQQLERALARFLGTEAALVFNSGHATNVTTIGHLLAPGDLVLHDARAHNSILEGCRLSGATRRSFPHNDWQACESLLAAERHHHRRVLIAIEGVYSMDGDYPDLPQFVRIKEQHQAMLLVDEAHSLGTMGGSGRGMAEHFGVAPRRVDLWMGTLSKTLGSCGGYIAASHELVEYLKYTVPGFVFSVGISPPNTAAALCALELLEREPQRVACLQANGRRFLELARAAGLDTATARQTPIVPIMTGHPHCAVALSGRLLARRVSVQPILPPAVASDASRLRFFITANHQEEQLRATVAALVEETADLATRYTPAA